MSKTLRVAAVVTVLLLGAATAWAQASGTGYAFGTPGQFRADGSSTTTFHAGGGGELLLGGRFGLGTEIGYLAPTRSWSDGIGVFSTERQPPLPQREVAGGPVPHRRLLAAVR